MKNIALILIVLVNLGNSSDNGSKKNLLSENNKTESSLKHKDKKTNSNKVECPIIGGGGHEGMFVHDIIYTYQVKKGGCFKTQTMINMDFPKLLSKCLVEDNDKDCNITIDDIELVSKVDSFGFNSTQVGTKIE